MKSIVSSAHVYHIPYLPQATTSEYMDLRRQPSRIQEIPELRQEPGLIPIVVEINHAAGEFITHACAVASRPPIERDCVIPIPDPAKAAGHWYTSYVMFSFWLLHQNVEERYRAIHDAYAEKDRYNICFVLQPTYFLSRYEQSVGRKWDERNATVCLIWTSGWGDTVKEAHEKWRTSIQDLVTFFRKRRMSNAPLERTGGTVSDLMIQDRV
jgi:hypothetical protein